MVKHTRPVMIVGAPTDLAARLASCVHSVSGCEARHHPTFAEAQQTLLKERDVGLLLVYLNPPANDPLLSDLLEVARTRVPAIPTVVIAESEENLDLGALFQAGATDCLARPLNLSRLSFLIDLLTLRGRTLARATEAVPAKLEHGDHAGLKFIFDSPQMKELQKAIERLAQVDSNVLLAGETGTGKTCLARMLHDLSPRSDKPFVVVNCGAIPESLMESELFGHGQGAFTGADKEYRGKFAQAEEGTIFLDEIDALPLACQSSLLRVVEDRAYEAVGSGKRHDVHSRFLFATNRDLDQEVHAGRFRQDLYYRLNVVSLVMPPLRERVSEIPHLVAMFLCGLREKKMTRVEGFTPTALAQMRAHDWPGNVRELRNIVERIAVLSDVNIVEVEHLPEPMRRSPAISETIMEPDLETPMVAHHSLHLARRAAERETIRSTLAECDDNRTLAADRLGISRTAFYKKLHQLGLT